MQLTENSRLRSVRVDVSANTRSLSAAAGVGGRGGNSEVLSLSLLMEGAAWPMSLCHTKQPSLGPRIFTLCSQKQ